MASTLKSSLLACLHLMPDWMNRVREDYKEEVSCGPHGWPIQLLEAEGRFAIWNVCVHLRVTANGVSGLACRLLERYLAEQLLLDDVAAESPTYERFRDALRPKIPVLIVSSVQIAAKSNSVASAPTATQVSKYLLRRGINYSVKDVITWEYHVFQTIGYRVPLWTCVDIAELLAVQVQFPPSLYEALGILVNVAERARDQIDQSVRWAAEGSDDSLLGDVEPPGITIRTLHFAAGAVAACARYLLVSKLNLERDLAQITDVPLSYIECIRDSILSITLDEEVTPTSFTTTKRKE